MKKIYWIIGIFLIIAAIVVYYFLNPAEEEILTTAGGDIINPDGSITTINDDGSTLTINPDGTFILSYPDDYEYQGDFIPNPDPGYGQIGTDPEPIPIGLPFGGGLVKNG